MVRVPGLKARLGGARAPTRHEWRRTLPGVLQHVSPQAPSRRFTAGTSRGSIASIDASGEN
jgi:hypothetical protein